MLINGREHGFADPGVRTAQLSECRLVQRACTLFPIPPPTAPSPRLCRRLHATSPMHTFWSPTVENEPWPHMHQDGAITVTEWHITIWLTSYIVLQTLNPWTPGPGTQGPVDPKSIASLGLCSNKRQKCNYGKELVSINVLSWTCAAAKVVSLCTYSPHRYVYTQKAFFMPDCTIYFTLSTSFFHSVFPNREQSPLM